MSFGLVPKSVTLNDLVTLNSAMAVTLRYFNFSFFCHNSRVWLPDRRTALYDRQDRVAYTMQRGKKWAVSLPPVLSSAWFWLDTCCFCQRMHALLVYTVLLSRDKIEELPDQPPLNRAAMASILRWIHLDLCSSVHCLCAITEAILKLIGIFSVRCMVLWNYVKNI